VAALPGCVGKGIEGCAGGGVFFSPPPWPSPVEGEGMLRGADRGERTLRRDPSKWALFFFPSLATRSRPAPGAEPALRAALRALSRRGRRSYKMRDTGEGLSPWRGWGLLHAQLLEAIA
jgi:hypothetical protein